LNSLCVIDSSVGISWVRAEQSSPETDQLLADVRLGRPMIVPTFWFTEIANILLVLQRRGKASSVERRAALVVLENLPLMVDEQSTTAAFHAVSDLAEKYGLTVYDATYLELALRRKASLATRDLPLRRAAERCGVPVI
jgi:predicted nucleic acid-binding protein